MGDGQESLSCCSPWGRKESDTTERLKWTELNTGTYCKERLLRTNIYLLCHSSKDFCNTENLETIQILTIQAWYCGILIKHFIKQ